MTRQQLFIYFLVGIMIFSVLGTGILLLSQGSADDSTTIQADPTTTNQTEDNVDRYLPDGDVTELEITDLVVGTGPAATAEDTITVHYTGWLASDGTVFDSSVQRGTPATFPLNQVIVGWQQGIPGMQVGGKRRLVIPSELGYGTSGNGGIPPNADLVFEVELLEIVN